MKTSMKTWEFLISVGEYKQAANQRMGQAMFNVAAKSFDAVHSPAIPFGIDHVDPFYDDTRIPAFLEFLKAQGYIED